MSSCRCTKQRQMRLNPLRYQSHCSLFPLRNLRARPISWNMSYVLSSTSSKILHLLPILPALQNDFSYATTVLRWQTSCRWAWRPCLLRGGYQSRSPAEGLNHQPYFERAPHLPILSLMNRCLHLWVGTLCASECPRRLRKGFLCGIIKIVCSLKILQMLDHCVESLSSFIFRKLRPSLHLHSWFWELWLLANTVGNVHKPLL